MRRMARQMTGEGTIFEAAAGILMRLLGAQTGRGAEGRICSSSLFIDSFQLHSGVILMAPPLTHRVSYFPKLIHYLGT
jgi:hypothetical protein